MNSRPHNFAAGPAALPLSVIKACQEDVASYKDSGMSILEINHRSEWFYEIRDALKQNLRSLLDVPATHEIIFLQGGARQQFAMLPLNYASSEHPGNYLITGHWGNCAIAEAEAAGIPYKVLWTGESNQYRKTPDQPICPDPNAAYLHVTSNETIHGVQLSADPDAWRAPDPQVPLVVDASSDLLSRRVPVERYALIYACAQKLCGIPGNTIVIANKEFIQTANTRVPKVWSYQNLFASDSIYNTSPVFPIYVTLKMTEWMMTEFGNVEAIERFNESKYQSIIEALRKKGDQFQLTADPAAQSRMNIVFHLPSEALTQSFIDGAAKKGLMNLKGHRALGGVRVSNYTAVSMDAIQELCNYINNFKAD